MISIRGWTRAMSTTATRRLRLAQGVYDERSRRKRHGRLLARGRRALPRLGAAQRNLEHSRPAHRACLGKLNASSPPEEEALPSLKKMRGEGGQNPVSEETRHSIYGL